LREFLLQDELRSDYDFIMLDPNYHPEYLTEIEEFRDVVKGGIDPDEATIYPFSTLPISPVLDADVIDSWTAATDYAVPYQSGLMERIYDEEGKSLATLAVI
jgi:hypothetical protein